jgi:hypothetical protein
LDAYLVSFAYELRFGNFTTITVTVEPVLLPVDSLPERCQKEINQQFNQKPNKTRCQKAAKTYAYDNFAIFFPLSIRVLIGLPLLLG